ncbi:quinon protein alcohol dehydrogenase-like superfamily, partial [Zopfochytrium polystomum]
MSRSAVIAVSRDDSSVNGSAATAPDHSSQATDPSSEPDSGRGGSLRMQPKMGAKGAKPTKAGTVDGEGTSLHAPSISSKAKRNKPSAAKKQRSIEGINGGKVENQTRPTTKKVVSNGVPKDSTKNAPGGARVSNSEEPSATKAEFSADGLKSKQSDRPRTRFEKPSKALRSNSSRRRKVGTASVGMTLAGVMAGDCPIIFTPDGSSFLAAASCCIKVFSLATGEIVRILSRKSSEGHERPITGLTLNPTNSFQVNSTVRLWDYTDGTLLMTWQLDYPIRRMSLDPAKPSNIYMHFIRDSSSSMEELQNRGPIVQAQLEVGNCPEVASILESISSNGLEARDGFVVHWKDNKFTVLHPDSGAERLFDTGRSVTCLAVHPSEPMVAVGLDNGAISFYHCLKLPILLDSSYRPIVTNMHWHANPVTSIAFTADGSYLLSGGHEGVLVIWQLNSGNKTPNFLPRLSSSILAVSTSGDHSKHAIVLRDNSIRIIDSANLRPIQSVVGLRHAGMKVQIGETREQRYRDLPILQSRFGTILIEPRQNLAVLPGNSGCLQFYNVVEDRHVMELETVPQNVVLTSAETVIGRSKPPVAEVADVAFSADGKWMGTVDTRPKSGSLEEVTHLKFWMFDDVQQRYVVCTRIESPHAASITSMSFVDPPNGSGLPLLLITASADGTFKAWQLHAQSADPPASRGNNAIPAAQWLIRSKGSYRGSPMSDCQVSQDSSVLAIASGPLVTLWDPWSGFMSLTLSHSPAWDHVSRIAFVDSNRQMWGTSPDDGARLLIKLRKESNPSHEVQEAEAARFREAWSTTGGATLPFLVALTRRRIHVWHLVSASVWWSLALPESDLVANESQAKSELRIVVDHETGVFAIAQVVVREEATPSPKVATSQEAEVGGDNESIMNELQGKPATTHINDSENPQQHKPLKPSEPRVKSTRRSKLNESSFKGTRQVSKTSILLFSPLSQVPIRTYVLPAAVDGIAFLPSSSVETKSVQRISHSTMGSFIHPASRLIVSVEGEIRVLESWNSSDGTQEGEIVPGKTDDKKNGLLTSMFGDMATPAAIPSVATESEGIRVVSDTGVIGTDHRFRFITETPSHLLPSTSAMLMPFFESAFGNAKVEAEAFLSQEAALEAADNMEVEEQAVPVAPAVDSNTMDVSFLTTVFERVLI